MSVQQSIAAPNARTPSSPISGLSSRRQRCRGSSRAPSRRRAPATFPSRPRQN